MNKLAVKINNLLNGYSIYCPHDQTCKFDKLVKIDSATSLGRYNFIGKYTHITSSVIGNYNSIGVNVLIGPQEHNIAELSTSSRFLFNRTVDLSSVTEIKNDVWVGSKSFIKRGVVIGNGAVIGAGAIVTKDVPDYAIVVGNPAKILKYRFEKAVIDILLESQWWNLDLDNAAELLSEINRRIGRISG